MPRTHQDGLSQLHPSHCHRCACRPHHGGHRGVALCVRARLSSLGFGERPHLEVEKGVHPLSLAHPAPAPEAVLSREVPAGTQHLQALAAQPPSSSGGFLNSINLPTYIHEQIKPFWDFQWCAGGLCLPRTLRPAPASLTWGGCGDEGTTALWGQPCSYTQISLHSAILTSIRDLSDMAGGDRQVLSHTEVGRSPP